jgi:hypothetical protein
MSSYRIRQLCERRVLVEPARSGRAYTDSDDTNRYRGTRSTSRSALAATMRGT